MRYEMCIRDRGMKPLPCLSMNTMRAVFLGWIRRRSLREAPMRAESGLTRKAYTPTLPPKNSAVYTAALTERNSSISLATERSGEIITSIPSCLAQVGLSVYSSPLALDMTLLTPARRAIQQASMLTSSWFEHAMRRSVSQPGQIPACSSTCLLYTSRCV